MKLIALISIVHKQGKGAALHKYLQRQYFKPEVLELKLWEHIRKIIKRSHLNNKRLEREYIITNLFEGDAKSLNRTSSRLYAKIKKFMVETFLNDNQIIQEWVFRESLKTEEMPNNHLKDLATDGLLNSDIRPKNRVEEAFQHFIRFHLNYELYQEKLENGDVELFNKVRVLFNEYFIRYYEVLEIEKEQRQKMFKEEIVDLIDMQVEKTSEDRTGILLSKAKNLEKKPLEFEYCKNKLIELVDNNEITRERQLVIFPLIFNFATRQSIKGNKHFLLNNIEYFIYLGFDKQILYVNNRVSIYIYTNFLSLIASSRKVTPIERFADKYLNHVEEKDLNKAKYFTEIFIAFYKKDYQHIIEIIHLNERNIKVGFQYSLRVRIWLFLICSYYELRYEDSLINALQSFRRYIKSLTISENKKDIYFRFIYYTRKVYKCDSLSTLKKLEKKLNSEDNITYRKWLEDKIKESYSKFS